MNQFDRTLTNDPREARSRSANRIAALLLIGGVIIAIIALALFT